MNSLTLFSRSVPRRRLIPSIWAARSRSASRLTAVEPLHASGLELAKIAASPMRLFAWSANASSLLTARVFSSSCRLISASSRERLSCALAANRAPVMAPPKPKAAPSSVPNGTKKSLRPIDVAGAVGERRIIWIGTRTVGATVGVLALVAGVGADTPAAADAEDNAIAPAHPLIATAAKQTRVSLLVLLGISFIADSGEEVFELLKADSRTPQLDIQIVTLEQAHPHQRVIES